MSQPDLTTGYATPIHGYAPQHGTQPGPEVQHGSGFHDPSAYAQQQQHMAAMPQQQPSSGGGQPPSGVLPVHVGSFLSNTSEATPNKANIARAPLKPCAPNG